MEVNKETGEIKQAPRGKGSFWISRKALEVLLENKATAMQINAYLVLAKHTDEGGRYSTAGVTAIRKATGVSQDVCDRAVQQLMQMKSANAKGKAPSQLLYSAEDWSKATGEQIPPAPFERAKVRHVLNDFGAEAADRVWFGNELVSGHGKFTQPLKRLKMCGDVAARLLLSAYSYNNLEQYGGVSPRFIYEAYDMTNTRKTVANYDLWHGEKKDDRPHSYGDVMPPVLGIKNLPSKEDERSDAMRPFWDAIKSLDKAGFIYEMVTVMDREAGNADAQVIYELDTKSRHGYKPKGEEGVAGITAKLSGYLDHPVTDGMGRFYGRYAAIVPAGVVPHVVGIWRIRFRVANNKNHGVAGAWARIHQGQKEAQEWLTEVAESVGIHVEAPNAAAANADDKAAKQAKYDELMERHRKRMEQDEYYKHHSDDEALARRLEQRGNHETEQSEDDDYTF